MPSVNVVNHFFNGRSLRQRHDHITHSFSLTQPERHVPAQHFTVTRVSEIESLLRLCRVRAECCTIELILILGMSACGGNNKIGQVRSTKTFQLSTAYVNYLTDTLSSPFTASGTAAGASVTGTGTVTSTIVLRWYRPAACLGCLSQRSSMSELPGPSLTKLL